MKKLLKKCITLALAAAMLLACVSCTEEKKVKEVNVNDLAQSLSKDITYVDTLMERDKDFMANVFELGDKSALIVNEKTYFNSGASAECISVVECKDGNDAALIKAAFVSYAKNSAEVYRSYNPTEADKLDKAVVEIVGEKYVAFCVSPDSSKAKEIIEK